MLLSFVIPVFNEQDTLRTLRDEIQAVANENGYELDIVFVDDGSSDASWDRICELSNEDTQVRGIQFRRNFGKAAALNAGFQAARGELVMTLDADLQDNPKEILASSRRSTLGRSTWLVAGSKFAMTRGTKSGPRVSSMDWSAGLQACICMTTTADSSVIVARFFVRCNSTENCIASYRCSPPLEAGK